MGTVVRDAEVAVAIARALRGAGQNLPLVMSPGPALKAVAAAGLPVVPENAADLEFTDDGFNIIEPLPAAKDPEAVATRAVKMANGVVDTATGAEIPMPVKSICVHGDRPNAAAVARAVRARLEAEGIELRSLYPLGAA
jgi:UPF0271 protein